MQTITNLRDILVTDKGISASWLNTVKHAAAIARGRQSGVSSEDGMEATVTLNNDLVEAILTKGLEDLPAWSIVGIGGDELTAEIPYPSAGKVTQAASPVGLFTTEDAEVRSEGPAQLTPVSFNQTSRFIIKPGNEDKIHPGYWAGPEPNGFEVVPEGTGLLCVSGTYTDGTHTFADFMRSVEPHSIIGEVFEDIPGAVAADPYVIGKGRVYVCYRDENDNLILASDPATGVAPWIVTVFNMSDDVVYDPDAATDPTKKQYLSIANELGIGLTITASTGKNVDCEVLTDLQVNTDGNNCQIAFGVKTIKVNACPTAVDYTKVGLDYSLQPFISGIEKYATPLPDVDCEGNAIPGTLFGTFTPDGSNVCGCIETYFHPTNLDNQGVWTAEIKSCYENGPSAIIRVYCTSTGFSLEIEDPAGTRSWTLSGTPTDPSGTVSGTISDIVCTEGGDPEGLISVTFDIGTTKPPEDPYEESCGLSVTTIKVPMLQGCATGDTTQTSIAFTRINAIQDIRLEESAIVGDLCTIATICATDCSTVDLIDLSKCASTDIRGIEPGHECTACEDELICGPGQVLAHVSQEGGDVTCACFDEGTVPPNYTECNPVLKIVDGMAKVAKGLGRFFKK